MRSQLKTPKMKMSVLLTGLVAGGLLLSGCSEVRGHQGYIVDPVLTGAISPGVGINLTMMNWSIRSREKNQNQK